MSSPMMLDARTTKRQLIRELLTACRMGYEPYLHAWGVSPVAATALADLEAYEAERLISESADKVGLDLEWLVRRARRNRHRKLVRNLVLAGCSNQLLRRRFGLGFHELAAMRCDLGLRNPGRPRNLTDPEKTLLQEWCRRHPCADCEHKRVFWCLRAWRRHRGKIPFMPIYHYVSQTDETRGKIENV